MIDIVAGPNGSGKTTFAEAFLIRSRRSVVFLNPDIIASGISTIDFEQASFTAGRLLLTEIKDRIVRGESFAFETTLAGRTYARILAQARTQGYEVNIFFLYLNKVAKNLQRIKSRVRAGGHDIPITAVLRRQRRCFDHFWHLYRPLCDQWYVFDNSGKAPKLLMSREDFDDADASVQASFICLLEKSGRSDV